MKNRKKSQQKQRFNQLINCLDTGGHNKVQKTTLESNKRENLFIIVITIIVINGIITVVMFFLKLFYYRRIIYKNVDFNEQYKLKHI